MTTVINIDDFRAAFVRTLRSHPPKLPDNTLSEESFAGWLSMHFSIHELAVFRRYEDAFGEEAADQLVYDCFEAADLPQPKKR